VAEISLMFESTKSMIEDCVGVSGGSCEWGGAS
jgi:hypothetical protein